MKNWELPVLYPREEKKITSKAGWALFLLLFATAAVQLGIDALVNWRAPQLADNLYYLWLSALIPQYCIGYPLAIYILCKLPKYSIPQNSLERKGKWRLFLICYSVLIFGSLLGSAVNGGLETVFGINTDLAMDVLMQQSSLLLVFLVAVVLGPVAEEFVFRKLLLDRFVKYGEFPAVMTSGIIFGLYHGNFEQFFYAMFVGWIFAYIYVKTGKIRYSIALHMLINFMGSVLPLYIFRVNSYFLLMLYSLAVLLFIVTGAVYAVRSRKSWRCRPADFALTPAEGAKIIWLNPGMTAAAVCILAFFYIGVFM